MRETQKGDQPKPKMDFRVDISSTSAMRKKTKLRNRRRDPLTIRERQIVFVLSEGITNKEIGRRLRLAEGTVKVHLHRIYRKLGIANRTTLAVLARTNSLDAA